MILLKKLEVERITYYVEIFLLNIMLQTNYTTESEEFQNVDESFQTEAQPSDKRPLQEDDTTEVQPVIRW